MSNFSLPERLRACQPSRAVERVAPLEDCAFSTDPRDDLARSGRLALLLLAVAALLVLPLVYLAFTW